MDLEQYKAQESNISKRNKGFQVKPRICKECNKSKPSDRRYFSRQVINNKEVLNEVCRECEEKLLFNKHWKDGKLLCLICNTYQDIDNFNLSKDKDYREGRDTRCRKCRTSQSRNARINKEGEDLIHRLITERWLGARDRAKKNNLDFNLTKGFIKELLSKQNNKCAISSIEMTFSLGKGRTPTNMSIDRKNTNGGYTYDNIHLICMAVNQMKSDLTKKELLTFCRAIVEKYKDEIL